MPMHKDEERIFIPVDQEFRVKQDGNDKIIEGYAAVFDKPADMGWYREYVRSSAFTKSLKDGADVRGLFNHDPNLILGRTAAKTLKLSTDKRGLYYEVKLPNTTYATDLYESCQRGDVSQNSFAFRKIQDNWYDEQITDEKGNNATILARDLMECQLYDISPVTYAAYPQTSLSARSHLNGIDPEQLTMIAFRLGKGLDVTEEQRNYYLNTIEKLTEMAKRAEPGNHSDRETEPDSDESTLLRYRLFLAEKIV